MFDGMFLFVYKRHVSEIKDLLLGGERNPRTQIISCLRACVCRFTKVILCRGCMGVEVQRTN